jgi:hypothetical protein
MPSHCKTEIRRGVFGHFPYHCVNVESDGGFVCAAFLFEMVRLRNLSNFVVEVNFIASINGITDTNFLSDRAKVVEQVITLFVVPLTY